MFIWELVPGSTSKGMGYKTEKESLRKVVNRQMVNRCSSEGLLLRDDIEHFSEKSHLKSKEDAVFILQTPAPHCLQAIPRSANHLSCLPALPI